MLIEVLLWTQRVIVLTQFVEIYYTCQKNIFKKYFIRLYFVH